MVDRARTVPARTAAKVELELGVVAAQWPRSMTRVEHRAEDVIDEGGYDTSWRVPGLSRTGPHARLGEHRGGARRRFGCRGVDGRPSMLPVMAAAVSASYR